MSARQKAILALVAAVVLGAAAYMAEWRVSPPWDLYSFVVLGAAGLGTSLLGLRFARQARGEKETKAP